MVSNSGMEAITIGIQCCQISLFFGGSLHHWSPDIKIWLQLFLFLQDFLKWLSHQVLFYMNKNTAVFQVVFNKHPSTYSCQDTWPIIIQILRILQSSIFVFSLNLLGQMLFSQLRSSCWSSYAGWFSWIPSALYILLLIILFASFRRLSKTPSWVAFQW